jgi:hypothetical protein
MHNSLIIRSQDAGFYKFQHTPCELSYNSPPLLKHPLNSLKNLLKFLNFPCISALTLRVLKTVYANSKLSTVLR